MILSTMILLSILLPYEKSTLWNTGGGRDRRIAVAQVADGC